MNHIAKECYSKHGYPPWYKNRDDHFYNNIIFGSDIDCKGNKNEGHTHDQQYSTQNKKGMQFTQEKMKHIWKIVQNSKVWHTHKAKNIVRESTVLTSKIGICIKKFMDP